MSAAFNNPLWLVLGIALLGAGVSCLYAAWRKRGSRTIAIIGWVVIAASVPVWAVWGGPDRGLAFALMSLCAAGLVPAFANAVRAPRKELSGTAPKASKRVYNAPPRALLRRSGTALRVVVLSLIGAYALATALYAVLHATGWQAANTIVLSLFAFPIIWAGLACGVSVPSRARTRWGIALLSPLLGAIVLAGVRLA